jgi:hypothetical protein
LASILVVEPPHLSSRCSIIVIAAVILLCRQTLAQSPPVKAGPKPVPSQTAPRAPAAQPNFSAEFLALGRKAFTALDRLNEHLLDTKTLVSRGIMMELSDEKESWILRETAAEKASDDVQAVTASPQEKAVAEVISNALVVIQRNHKAIDNDTEIAVDAANAHERQMEQERIQGPFLTEIIALDAEGVRNTARRAMDRASTATRELVTSPCYLAAKEAVGTGVLENAACEAAKQKEAQRAASEAKAKSESELAEDERRNAIAKQLTKDSGPSWEIRAEGRILIWASKIPLEPATPPEEFAATFYRNNVGPNSRRTALRSVGFSGVRLEVGSKAFDWPIQ